ncbi:MAG: hypothetical protein JW958_02085 [Candidatus Eisenbacteria bacterium]|nr:hypothetical protein [Candidatus Eisenbacteria bacterium]
MDRRFPILLVFFFAIFCTASRSGAETPRIRHTPPAPPRPGESTVLLFTWNGDGRAITAELRIRAIGDTLFTRLPLEERPGAWRVEVPARYAAPPGFEYAFVVRTEDGSEATSPDRFPAEAPHEIVVRDTGAGEEGADRVVVLSPEPEERLPDGGEFLLSVLFDPPLLPPAEAVLYLDGAEIAEGVERTEDYLLYAPELPPAEGGHEATVVLLNEGGGSAERSWRFSIGAEKRAAASRFVFTGKAEAGYAVVNACDVRGDPYLPYDETSSLAFDMYAYGNWRERSFYLAASRDPIYDDEIRASARLSGERLTLEAGDIFPTLTELSVSWLSGEGGLLSWEGERWRSAAFLLRTVEADTTGGFGIYSQYITGGRIARRADRWEAGLNAAYGWERESSVPDTIRFLLPIRNLVYTADIRFRFTERIRLDMEAGWSESEGDDTTGAPAWRAVLAYADRSERTLSLEARDYRSGFSTLGNPTVDGGEYGFLLDGSIRAWGFLRQTARVEIVRDRESSQPIRAGGEILELYGRTDVDVKGAGIAWNFYALLRSYEIPYEENPYRSRYGTAGIYLRRDAHTLSLNFSRSLSRSSAETDGWNGSVYWSGAAGILSWRVGERWGASETTQDTSGAGTEEILSDEDRWTFTSETTLRAGGLEWRAEYERIDQEDRAEEERLTEHLFALTVGRRF